MNTASTSCGIIEYPFDYWERRVKGVLVMPVTDIIGARLLSTC